ncbi:MAG: nitroreductase [Moraxellaceae bacterium]|nr:nitroreductase [Moraxellaceae bacterium]
METLESLLTRRSRGVLTAPPPPPELLKSAFAAALCAPDHRQLQPWRFLVIEGEGLVRLGEVFAHAARVDNPALEPAESERLKKMPLRAPLIVVAIAIVRDDPKVPRDEFLLSTGAAIQNFLLTLHDGGYGAMWRTGPMAAHEQVRSALGVAGHERIAGFIYAGMPGGNLKPRPTLAVDAFVRSWSGE